MNSSASPGGDKATVHRHLSELEQNGFLEQHPVTRAYRLGPAILRLSAVRETTNPLRSVVRPIILELSNEVGELVHFSLLQGLNLSPVHNADPRIHGTQVFFEEAELLPLARHRFGPRHPCVFAREICGPGPRPSAA